jgi:hypothetical protein
MSLEIELLESFLFAPSSRSIPALLLGFTADDEPLEPGG